MYKERLVAEGQYQYGERIGVWNRWYRTADVELSEDRALQRVPWTVHFPSLVRSSAS